MALLEKMPLHCNEFVTSVDGVVINPKTAKLFT